MHGEEDNDGYESSDNGCGVLDGCVGTWSTRNQSPTSGLILDRFLNSLDLSSRLPMNGDVDVPCEDLTQVSSNVPSSSALSEMYFS